ncbi:uncharacterized protein ASCRUDRAFT_75234 [Ascoidea rubescens DSM 1968]|uniref:Uncharacterized protein n=1 Tax=Ascoidea rubescens DSM 1968 TaxID=1344418 RepID=A0A1D2VK84_9ASCO|nr:hypothetical protein ASCRUDRAFT_75234 [Ascoidea rubescens DSM 1968]ODV62003.1 hypothetical protein ASCRUDRAFT_75234 [Ascoidea rubescens DSM 1968]
MVFCSEPGSYGVVESNGGRGIFFELNKNCKINIKFSASDNTISLPLQYSCNNYNFERF